MRLSPARAERRPPSTLGVGIALGGSISRQPPWTSAARSSSISRLPPQTSTARSVSPTRSLANSFSSLPTQWPSLAANVPASLRSLPADSTSEEKFPGTRTQLSSDGTRLRATLPSTAEVTPRGTREKSVKIPPQVKSIGSPDLSGRGSLKRNSIGRRSPRSSQRQEECQRVLDAWIAHGDASCLPNLEERMDLSDTRPIGAGAYSQVRLMRDFQSGRFVAVKVMSLDEESSKEAKVLNELSRTEHPGIVKFLDVMLHAKQLPGCLGKPPLLCIVTEYVRNARPLAHLIGQLSADLRLISQIVVNLAETLAVVHSKGIVHRDIWSENVLCYEDGAIVLLDFGSAEHFRIGPDAVRPLNIPYMSPEAVRRQRQGPGDDLWSFGLLLSEMLTGKFIKDRLRCTSKPMVPESAEMNDLLDDIAGSGRLSMLCADFLQPDQYVRPAMATVRAYLESHPADAPSRLPVSASAASTAASSFGSTAGATVATQQTQAAVINPARSYQISAALDSAMDELEQSVDSTQRLLRAGPPSLSAQRSAANFESSIRVAAGIRSVSKELPVDQPMRPLSTYVAQPRSIAGQTEQEAIKVGDRVTATTGGQEFDATVLELPSEGDSRYKIHCDTDPEGVVSMTNAIRLKQVVAVPHLPRFSPTARSATNITYSEQSSAKAPVSLSDYAGSARARSPCFAVGQRILYKSRTNGQDYAGFIAGPAQDGWHVSLDCGHAKEVTHADVWRLRHE